MESLPRFVHRSDIDRIRGERARPGRGEGLWVIGTLEGLAAPCVALVGSRAPSEAGRALAWRLARDLGAAGVGIISGLALGIDAAAHGGAIAAGATTIGVLGGGHERFFPKRNRELADAMITHGGAVVSPYAPAEPSFPSRFLERNGVIVALCDAVVIVEAAARSGALNTASWAADAGIALLAVPGDVDRPKVAGCLTLIRDGATLVRNADDILEALGLARPTTRKTQGEQLRLAFARTEQRLLLQALQEGASDVDALTIRTRLAAEIVISSLSLLAMEGVVIAEYDGSFRLA